MKNIGILGGSFDPIHNGHINIALEAAYAFHLDTVFFIPAASTPLKEKQPIASAFHRYRMVELGIQAYDRLDILDWEIHKTTPCYTIDTAKLLKANWPKFNFSWIIGSDILPTLHLWKDIGELAKLIHFVVIKRPHHQTATVNIPNLILHSFENISYTISSSLIRDKLSYGEAVDDLVPEAVLNYINIHNLYHDQ